MIVTQNTTGRVLKHNIERGRAKTYTARRKGAHHFQLAVDSGTLGQLASGFLIWLSLKGLESLALNFWGSS